MSATSTGIKIVCELEISNDSHHLAKYVYVHFTVIENLILAAPKAAAENITLVGSTNTYVYQVERDLA